MSHSGRREKRSPREGPSSDSLPVADHLTAQIRSTTKSNPAVRPDEPGTDAESGSEANIILIAHPQARGLGTRFRLPAGGALEIGRSPKSEISLPEVLSISRSHARLEYRSGSVILRDLTSTNGTYVNDIRIDRPTVLKSGDRFQVGTVHFKLLHEEDVEHAYHIAIFDLVTRDGLTGAFNKRKFDEELEREFARARRYERPLALILADIDHFKNVNDTYGHLVGDFVLKHVASIVRGALRAEQVFARVGGEEFAILSPELQPDGARFFAEKLRARIESTVCHQDDDEIGITCSFGVSGVGADVTRPDDLIRAADRALYRSKNTGRNRVTLSGDP
jgi:diguanylate cyclase (GGDEF)-like protein